MFPASLYRYIWQTTRRRQLLLCLLTGIVVPLSAVPLELQRRIVDDALPASDISLLFLLGAAYVAVVLASNGLKYLLNITKGKVLEDVARDIRLRMLRRTQAEAGAVPDGTVIDVVAAEAEEVAGFASESLSVPLLQSGTILVILGYLLWVEPLIAGLAILIYLPQAIVVPRVQHHINRLARLRTRSMRRLGNLVVRHRRGDEAWEEAALRGLVDRIYGVRLGIYRRKFFLTFFGNVLDAAGPIAILMLGGWLVLQGETPVGTLIVFISGFQRIADPWDQLVTFYRSVSNARIAYGLVSTAVDGAPPPDVTETTPKKRTPRQRKKPAVRKRKTTRPSRVAP